MSTDNSETGGMNPLVDAQGHAVKPVDPSIEKAIEKRIKKFEEDVRAEEWKRRHPILTWCNGECWVIFRNAIATMVGVSTLVGALVGASQWLGWPDYVTNIQLAKEINRVDTKLSAYFTNLQRMAWVTRTELLHSRLTAISSQRAEFENAISLHQRESSRKEATELEKDAANRRIRALRVELEKLDREELRTNNERNRYLDLLDKSSSGPIGPTDVPPPPEWRP
jgi:hypothetical protein